MRPIQEALSLYTTSPSSMAADAAVRAIECDKHALELNRKLEAMFSSEGEREGKRGRARRVLLLCAANHACACALESGEGGGGGRAYAYAASGAYLCHMQI